MKSKTNVLELFQEAKANQTYVKVCAPMVRYSKVQFRTLVKNFGVDLCFTPMILADSFCQNAKARSNEFVTTTDDTPLIMQFAAKSVDEFLDASKLVYPYVDGVDLNCGCPQRWAMKDGYGCALLSKPELVHNLLRSVRNNFPSNFTVSVKVRILQEVKKTIVMCQQLEKCGIDFMTVHGRTPLQKSGDAIDVETLKDICDRATIPVIANGGIKSIQDADQLHDILQCSGIMAASGILNNPALFKGFIKTPISCIKQWMDLKNKSSDKITFQCYHHHLVFMLEKILTKKQKQEFNYLSTFESVDNFLYTHIINECNTMPGAIPNIDDFVICQFDEQITDKHSSKCRRCSKSMYYCTCACYDYDSNNGSYFTTYVKDADDADYMDSSIFEETS